MLTKEGHNLLKVTPCGWMNRNNKPSNKENNVCLKQVCLLQCLLKCISHSSPCLATPGILHGSAVPLVWPILFAITEVSLSGNKDFMGSLEEIGWPI